MALEGVRPGTADNTRALRIKGAAESGRERSLPF